MQIKTAACQLAIEPLEPMVLPSYKGSTLRGGFGIAFRRSSCALQRNDCNGCLLADSCAYSYIFETPPPSRTRVMRKYTAAPHPFIIEPPEERRQAYKPGDELLFGLILVGKAISYTSYFIHSFDALGAIGLGKGRARFKLKRVTSGGSTIYDPQERRVHPVSVLSLDVNNVDPAQTGKRQRVSLTFETPTRIKHNGRLTIDMEFHHLVRSLLRRLALLGYFHCGLDPDTWDFAGLIRRAIEVRTTLRDLKWLDWERYSIRQGTRMRMGGFLGRIAFEGDLSPFLDILKAGEILHVGKGATFGLGKYRLEQYC